MIDRLLLSLSRKYLPVDTFEMLIEKYDRISCFSPDGVLLWEKPMTAKIRSDSPDLNLRFVGDGIHIWGSPAMLEQKNNVFGSMDIVHCADLMIKNASKALEVVLPNYKCWELKGLDITHSLYLPSVDVVLTALTYLGKMSHGKLKTMRYPESVYFGFGSKTRTLKIYSKYFHLLKLNRKKSLAELGLTQEQLELTRHLLRVECVLKQGFLKRYFQNEKQLIQGRTEKRLKRWYEMTEDDLNVIYVDFWEEITGNALEVPGDHLDLLNHIEEVAAKHDFTKGYANAAFRTWTTIQAVGVAQAQYMSTESTYYRHLKLLKLAGLNTADFNEGSVQPVRISTLDLKERVNSFDDIRILKARKA